MTTTADGTEVVLEPQILTEWACGDLLAVDPSLNGPGAALFRGGRLVAAERVRVEKAWAQLGLEQRAVHVASAIVRWGMAHNMEPRGLALERPKVYNATKSVADPADLIALAIVAGNVSGMLSLALAGRGVAFQVIGFEPGEWSSGLPKVKKGDPWSSPRGQRIRSRLDGDEIRAIVASHDALDAVGVGLHAMGRMGIRRLLSGAV